MSALNERIENIANRKQNRKLPITPYPVEWIHCLILTYRRGAVLGSIDDARGQLVYNRTLFI